MTEEQRHWLERKVEALDALYRRFGREGFKDQQLTDVQLLLSFKEMQFRDAAKGRDLGEAQKAENRRLELEISDLRAYVKGYIAGLGGGNFWKSRDWIEQGSKQPKQPEREQSQGGRER
jgi:hypothetical protein